MDICNAAWVFHIDNHKDIPLLSKSQTVSYGVAPNCVNFTLYCMKVLGLEELVCSVGAGKIVKKMKFYVTL